MSSARVGTDSFMHLFDKLSGQRIIFDPDRTDDVASRLPGQHAAV